MNIINEEFNKAYLSIINESENIEMNKKEEKDQKEITPPIDDLTKESFATIDEGSEEETEEVGNTLVPTEEAEEDDEKENLTVEDEAESDEAIPEAEQETNVEATLTAEDGEEPEDEFTADESEDEFEEDEDGWGDSIREILDPIMEDGESLFYEVKNCVRGSFTDCKTRSELANYLRNYAEEINAIADEL